MDLTLIIPAYNEEAYIGATLEVAIKNTRGKLREVIVVDNASTDRTAAIARGRSGVRVINAPQKGITSARQAGYEAASSEWIAYIDADTHISESWIDVAEKVLHENPDSVSLSGPRRHFDAPRWKCSLLNALWIFAPIVYRTVGYMILGGNFIVRRSAVTAIGGFNRSIAFYGEDTDLARRLRAVGQELFRMDFYVYASARRYSEEGIWKPTVTYMLNYLWPALFGRPFTKDYIDAR